MHRMGLATERAIAANTAMAKDRAALNEAPADRLHNGVGFVVSVKL
jgi:hypothetical protein